jgi:ubiquinone/menaquinone biosynthesis C-methylase UbiE
MFDLIANNQNRNSLAAELRNKRAAFFKSLLVPLKKPIRILDVGGAEIYWKMVDLEEGMLITLLNLEAPYVSLPNCVSIKGDARKLDFESNAFDVVFSNSTIEHVGDYEDQKQMAEEVTRVGKRYFIQTPNKYFPIEPHFLFPFFQFLPFVLRVWLLQNFKLGWFPKTPNRVDAEKSIASIRLLGKREFAQLFPNAKIYEEKVLGLTKSFIAYEGWGE